MTARLAHRPAEDDYDIRPFDADKGDRAGFLDLYDRVFGGDSPAWFDWKYVEDPYTDHVPVIVAVSDGAVVGAKAAMPFELAAGTSGSVTALQPCDTMVHPDHRRKGLYSRMTDLMTTRYADGSPALLFNFPNSATLAGGLKHGWRIVTRVPTYYRVQDAGAFVGTGRALGTLAGLVSDSHLRVRSGLAADLPADVTVTRHTIPRPSLLASVAAEGRPNRLHAARTAEFYRWRLANPTRDYTAYVAERDGAVRAAAVVGTDPDDSAGLVEVVDLSPLSGATGDGVVRSLLARIVAEHADARAIAVSGLGLPDGVLREYGFLSDLSWPLSSFATPTTLVAYPLHEDPALADVHDPDGWALRGLEQDTR